MGSMSQGGVTCGRKKRVHGNHNRKQMKGQPKWQRKLQKISQTQLVGDVDVLVVREEVLDGGSGRRARVLIPFPMELSNQLDSSKTEDNENLTEIHPSTPSEHLHSSNLSSLGVGDGNDHESDSDDKSEGASPRSHSNMANSGDPGLAEGSTGRVSDACPRRKVRMPARFVQGKF